MKKLILLTIFCLLLSNCTAIASNIDATGSANVGPVQLKSVKPDSTPTPRAVVPTAVPVSPTAIQAKVPEFDHIVLIVLENRDYQDVKSDQSMPFLNSLAQQNVLLSNYFAIRHPSLPNYISLVSGSTQNISKDCTDCFVNQPNLADLIEASGRSWKTYQEDLPSPCYVGNAPPYFQKHNPFIYFDSIRLDLARCQRSILPLDRLDADLSSKQLPNFAFIMPNICNSGHECPPSTADHWLKDMITKLQASSALGKNSLIIVTFDEAGEKTTGSCCGIAGKGGGQIMTVLVSALARPGFKDPTPYSHYSLLKTILTSWNLPALANTGQPGTEAIEAPWSGSSADISEKPLPVTPITPSGSANLPANCSAGASVSGKYTINVCLSAPSAGAVLSGDVTLTATVDFPTSTTSVSAGSTQRVVFYLDGSYLLSDYQSPYTFTLPSEKWANGNHIISVEAQMRDGLITPQASLTVNFNNGTTTPPAQSPQFQPSTGRPSVDNAPFIVAAAGDGASGEDNATKVSDLIASLNPNLFLYLGDVYEKGSPTEFFNWYGSAGTGFGRFRSVTNPTVGNHEYLTDAAAGYFDYWKDVPDYYSFNAHGWHFISLDSNGGKQHVGPDSPQYRWLENDLLANSQACTIVYYHHPLYNIGPEGATLEMTDMWKLMAQAGVTIVLNGHDHDYQRWKPLDGDGQPAQAGITEFVAGASGHGLQTIRNSDDRVAFFSDTNPTAFGVLLLQLNRDGASFNYRNAEGSNLDSGVIPCATKPADTQAPGSPGTPLASSVKATSVKLGWIAASDNTGIAGYAIYRDGLLLANLPGSSLEYTDETAMPNTSYSYSVRAIDAAGNQSAASDPLQVTTEDIPLHLAFPAEADTYVNATSPQLNYGNASILRADALPDLHSYLRFNVQGLGGKSIAHAVLKIYANSASSRGINAYSVAANNWDEGRLSYDIAPPLGQSLGLSGRITQTGVWISIDVTGYVAGEGQFSFGINTTGSTAISIASRESGANAPQLVIDLH